MLYLLSLLLFIAASVGALSQSISDTLYTRPPIWGIPWGASIKTADSIMNIKKIKKNKDHSTSYDRVYTNVSAYGVKAIGVHLLFNDNGGLDGVVIRYKRGSRSYEEQTIRKIAAMISESLGPADEVAPDGVSSWDFADGSAFAGYSNDAQHLYVEIFWIKLN